MFYSRISYLSTPVCFHRLSRATMEVTERGSACYLDVQRATLVPIHLPVHIHICSTLHHKIHTTQFRLHPPVTSAGMRKPSYPTVALRLKSQPHWRVPVHRPFKPSLPPTLLPTRPHKCLNHLNYLFLPGQPTKGHCWYRASVGGSMGGYSRALRKSYWRTCKNLST